MLTLFTGKFTTPKEMLIKSFDRLRMNGNLLISFVIDCRDAEVRATHGAVAESLSNHERNQFVQRFPNKPWLNKI
jgi:hypothetical protein